MNKKYEFINFNDSFHHETGFTSHDEWLIIKAVILDNEKLLLSVLSKENNLNEKLLKNFKTHESGLDLLSTAAKYLKKNICQCLIERFNFDPNVLSNDGTPLHWLVKSNIIDANEASIPFSQYNPTKFQFFTETFECLLRNNCDLNIKDSKGYTPLHYASLHDNYGAALLLLNQKSISLNEFENHGMNALHIACKYGCNKVAILLIEKLELDLLNSLDENKMLPLHYACACKIEKLDIVINMFERLKIFFSNEDLIEIFLCRKNKFGDNPLNLAIKENHLILTEFFLRNFNNPKFNSDYDRNLPIHNAAKYGSIDMLNLIEKFNLISFESNNNWENVFHIAALENKSNFLEELLNKYSQNNKYKEEINFAINLCNKKNQTPLDCAIVRGSVKCAKLLLDQIGLEHLNPQTFELCILYNQKKMLNYLIELNRLAQDKFLSKTNCSKNTILHFTSIHKNFQLFKLIIDNILVGNLPFDLIHATNQKDETCFLIACRTGQYEIVEYFMEIRKFKLFDYYDPLNDRDDSNATSMHQATMMNHFRIIELLIENGADVNAQDKFDKIPLHYSCEMGILAITKLLIEHKSKINSFDIYNKSPLDYSCQIGHNELVRYLLDNGANVHSIDNNYYNCLDIAIDKDHTAVVETLLNDKNLNQFIYFDGEKHSKLKKMIIKMPFNLKVLLDNCYDNYKQKYDFHLIDNPKYKPTENHPLWFIATYQQKCLLSHKTVKKLLELKMRKYPRYIFWINLFFYLIFLILLTFHHVNISMQSDPIDIYENENDVSSETNLYNVSEQIAKVNNNEKVIHLWPLPFKFAISYRSARILFWSFKTYFIILLIIFFTKIIMQIYNYGIKMLSSLEYWLEIFCFLFNILAVSPFAKRTASAFGSISILLGWISFSFFFQKVGAFKLGSYSIALRKTIQNSFKFLPFFFMIYFGFLSSFKIREKFGVSYFNNTVYHMIRTITMMVGELQTDTMGLNTENYGFDFFTNNFIYVCFIFIMCIIVLDLFIGIEVGEIKTVVDEAETQNVAMNLIYVLKVQKFFYEIYQFFKPNEIPTFMNFCEYYNPIDENLSFEKRPDLLNRVENYIMSMSHSFDQKINEQIKEISELNEHVENIMKQLDILKKSLNKENKLRILRQFKPLTNKNNSNNMLVESNNLSSMDSVGQDSDSSNKEELSYHLNSNIMNCKQTNV